MGFRHHFSYYCLPCHGCHLGGHLWLLPSNWQILFPCPPCPCCCLTEGLLSRSLFLLLHALMSTFCFDYQIHSCPLANSLLSWTLLPPCHLGICLSALFPAQVWPQYTSNTQIWTLWSTLLWFFDNKKNINTSPLVFSDCEQHACKKIIFLHTKHIFV